MFRIIALIGAILGSAGVAHAQDQIVVTVAGKAPRIVKAELFRAARAVCTASTDPLDWANTDACTEATFDDALQRFRGLPQPDATLHTVAAR